MTQDWTLDRAIDFARSLVNHDEPKFRQIGQKLLALKDENLILTCKAVSELTSKLVEDISPSQK